MRRLALTFIAILALYSIGWAQPYISDNGRFEVDQVSGCAPLTVNVTIRPPYICNGASPCDMDYEYPVLIDFETNDFTHTYAQPGTYTLRILFQTLGFDQITINVSPDIPPAIQVFKCSGNGIQLRIPDINYDNYVIDYDNDGTPELVVPQNPAAQYSYTYPTSGPKLLAVHGRNVGAADNCTPTIIPINSTAALPVPIINQLQLIDNTSARLDFGNIENNVYYKLEIATNANGFQPLRDVFSSATQTVTGLNNASNYYCFRLGVFDPCSNTIVNYSNIICSADFDVTAINNSNELAWRTNSSGVGSYAFSRNPNPTVPITAVPPQTTLSDTDITCNVEYCYQMTTLYSNGSRSISLSSCATAISTVAPPATENISIQVTATSSLDLIWTQDPAYTPAEYTIFKEGQQYGKNALPEFTDNTYLLNANACYSVSYIDACGNQSALSAVACPINLSAALQPDNSVILHWNAFNGWLNGVDHYSIERLAGDGQSLGAVNIGTDVTYTDAQAEPDHQIIVYRIVAYAVDGSVAESISNAVTITKKPNIYHPNTFTPNSDGLNDTFKVISQYTSSVEFMVFNRWGEMLFYTTDLSLAWDGTYKGNVVPEGTYTFRCFLTDQAGAKYERSGNVVVLRKSP